MRGDWKTFPQIPRIGYRYRFTSKGCVGVGGGRGIKLPRHKAGVKTMRGPWEARGRKVEAAQVQGGGTGMLGEYRVRNFHFILGEGLS